MPRRQSPPTQLVRQVLTESGYRCAVPTCRNILALDIHHIVEVSDGGPNELANLLALCPTCHALFHRGNISRESIYAWKGILVSLNRAFDFAAIDDLLFLGSSTGDIYVSGDGILRLSRLIVSGLVTYHYPGTLHAALGTYLVRLTAKGIQLVDAWKSGNRHDVGIALGQPLGNSPVVAV